METNKTKFEEKKPQPNMVGQVIGIGIILLIGWFLWSMLFSGGPSTTSTSSYTLTTAPVQRVVTPIPTKIGTPVQRVVTPTQNTINTSNIKYADAIQANVIPFLTSAYQDLTDSANAGSHDDLATALQDAQGAQTAIAKARAGYERLSPAPSDLVNINTLMGKVITSLSNGANELILGIKTINTNKIRDAEAYINQANAYTTQATALLQQVNAQ